MQILCLQCFQILQKAFHRISRGMTHVYKCMFACKDYLNTIVVSPSKTTTSPQQVHEGHTDEAIHIQDQVGFLNVHKQQKNL